MLSIEYNGSHSEMKIDYRDKLPSVAAYSELFETTGWNNVYKAPPDALHQALQQSWYTVSAYDTGRLVGFGRVVSDGVLYAMIYDLIVIPSHRRRGIGSEILRSLVARCQEAGIREVQLFSAAGKSEFYQTRGFEDRPANAPGMRLRKQ